MTGTPPPGRVTLVLGAAAGGMGAHVRMLAAGLADRGIAVTVTGPSSVGARFSPAAVPAVSFTPVEIGGRPRPGDLAQILRLRRLLLHPPLDLPPATSGDSADSPPGRGSQRCPADGAGRGPDGGATGGSALADGGRPAGDWPAGEALGGNQVVHAHGLRAGALTALALLGARARRPGIVVTVHNAPPAGGAAGLVYRLLERVAARGADLVLCVSPDLERRMRAAGARRVQRAVIAAPATVPSARAAASASAPAPAPAGAPVAGPPLSAADPVGAPEGRPVVLAAGRLAAQKDFGVLLTAAATWRDLDPVPRVVIAGDGPLAGELRAQAAALGVAAEFPGHRDDMPALLAAAAVFVLPSRWEGQPLVLQEALRAGTPVVATRAGGIPVLAGDAALLVPPGDARALADAVRAVLTSAPLAARLRAAAAARAAALPSQADAVTAALAAYASVPARSRLR